MSARRRAALARQAGATALLAGVWLAGPQALAQPAPAPQREAAQVAATALEDMQRRINNGQFAAAYQAGKAHAALLGDAHFDFLFGVAAANSGHSAEAVLALQRHLAAVPGNDRARLDLARAYFDLGDYARARQEFEFVLRYKPPAEVQANIARYLDSMQSREMLGNRASTRFYAETGWGQDSNANLGTFNDTINAPGLGGLQIDPSSKAQDSNFAWLALGGRWVRQVNPAFAVFAGMDMDSKLNQQAPRFDTANLSGYAGFSQVAGPVLYRLSASDTVTQVNNARYMGRLAANGEAQWSAGEGTTYSGRLQYAEQAYAGDISYRDATVETLGLGVEQALSLAWRPVLGLQLTQAREDNLTRRLDLSRVTDTWRVSLGLNPTEKSGLLLAYSEQASLYQAPDPGFGSVRSDTLATLDLVWSQALERNLTLRVDLQQSENKSNQSLYAYRRVAGGFKFRYSF